MKATGNKSRRTDRRRAVGARAEDICEADLKRRGWRVLARNWRVRAGELDLIAIDGPTLVVVEVKSGKVDNRAGPATPAQAVGPQKQRRLRRLASIWLATEGRGLRFGEVRFDVVGISFASDGQVASCEHIENAF